MSSHKKAVEKYDFDINVYRDMPQLEYGGFNMSSCYFRNGMKSETLWVLS